MVERSDSSTDPRARFIAALGGAYLGEELFDAVPDTVFFIKDRAGRYVALNRTLVTRSGRKHRNELIGRTTLEVFPGALGEHYAAQDRAVVDEGHSIHGRLELHLYPSGEEGWCLTWKEPILDAHGAIIGLSGISRDTTTIAGPIADMPAVSRAIEHIHKHLDQPLRMADIARAAGLSAYQFDIRMRSLFGLTPGQYLIRERIALACTQLKRTDLPISRIALDCGYGDQAAFTRQFHRSVGLTPTRYKMHYRNAGD